MKIVKQLAGTIKALWHKSLALWSMGLYSREDILLPSGLGLRVWGYKSHTTRNPWYNITLLSTPFNAHPNLQSPQTNPTIHNKYTHNHSKTTNRELWCVCWKDRCRDGNLRTYCHVSPILFGWKPALHVFAFL